MDQPPTRPNEPVEVDPRVPLAAERTLLAWMRTGLALMGFGFVVARFGLFLRELMAVGHLPEPVSDRSGLSLWFGVGLVGLGVWVLIGSAIRYGRYVNALAAGRPRATPGPGFGVGMAIVLAVVGVGMVAYLLVVG